MKINEKNLCMFATTPPVDLEGWLNKRGEINKSWQKRWFVLKGNLLFYFERKGDREPLGMIILEGCTVELAEDGEQYCFQVIFHGPNNRTYYLSTETQSNMEQWMKALTCAGYDYMKLMVAELQRQLDEIEGTKEKTPEISPLPPPKAPPRRQNPFNKPPVEYASNAVFVSPQVIRKAPTVPVGLSAVSSPSLSSRLINLELKSPSEITSVSEYQNETSQTPASESSITGLSRSASGISSKSSTGSGNGVLNVVDLLAVVSDEWSFERMHSLLGTPVLADLHARKITMEKKSEQPPLILF